MPYIINTNGEFYLSQVFSSGHRFNNEKEAIDKSYAMRGGMLWFLLDFHTSYERLIAYYEQKDIDSAKKALFCIKPVNEWRILTADAQDGDSIADDMRIIYQKTGTLTIEGALLKELLGIMDAPKMQLR